MKYRVPVLGSVGRSIDINPKATEGATIGENLFFADGTPATLDSLAKAITTEPRTSDITKPFFNTTPAEAAAGVLPTDFYREPGDVRRYGDNTSPGTTDMSTALQNAIDQNDEGGPEVILQAEKYAFGTTLQVSSGVSIRGQGSQVTELAYTGSAQGFVSKTPASRIFGINFSGFRLDDEGTGTIGIDLERWSSSLFSDIVVNGFTTSVEIDSPTSGHAVYNRFYNVTAQNATTGFLLTGTSSNANVFTSCRTNLCTTGALLEDSNENHFNFCQFEGGATGVSITASIPAISPRNMITNCRFEGVSTNNIIIGSDVSDTALLMNHHVDGTALSDSGTRTQVIDVQGNKIGLSLVSALAAASGTPFIFERTAQGGSNVPAVILRDSATTSGTPTTVQIETGRSAGHSIRVRDGVGGPESFGVEARGRLRTNQASTNTNTPSGATSNELPLYDETGALIGYIPIYGSQW
tara:strand:+ start:4226 stop:5626 length:1401 start_codon:yes stop_codon:yes gene_type:complete